MVGTGSHRGFTFVDCYTKQDAKVNVFVLHVCVCVFNLIVLPSW